MSRADVDALAEKMWRVAIRASWPWAKVPPVSKAFYRKLARIALTHAATQSGKG